MSNLESIVRVVEAGDMSALVALIDKWISSNTAGRIDSYKINSISSCEDKPVESSRRPVCANDWPEMLLASTGNDIAEHLGIKTIWLTCPHCCETRELSVSHAWITRNEHSYEKARKFISLIQCTRCKRIGLVISSDWDSDPDYLFNYRGHIWLDDIVSLIRLWISASGNANSELEY